MQNIRDIAKHGELLFSWGRYLYWAELRQRDWDRFMTEKGADAEKAIPEWLGVSCYWAASLYVVIEGWEAGKFKDPIIDALLRVSNYKDLLRRIRNGTFHFQPELTSPKTEFLEPSDATLWLHFIHEEFCRWLRSCVEAVGSALLSPEEAQEWRGQCAELFGWLPMKPAEEKLNELREMLDETEKELDASGDDSDAAKDLRSSFGLYDTAVNQVAQAVRKYRRELLERFGLNPDDYIP
jgi:hypothetical protein